MAGRCGTSQGHSGGNTSGVGCNLGHGSLTPAGSPADVLARLGSSGNPTNAGLQGHRTFSVARPIIARMSEMIQNRITICGSAQPFFSKW